jgi:16S rRNA (guanine527-N7)-methyltransferase
VKLDPESPIKALTQTQRSGLARYEGLLRDRAVPLGLISEGDRDRVWERHITDSLRALPCLPRRPVRILDVGSGAGLPGIPLAIGRPDCSVMLIEPRARAVAFLELAVEALRLPNARVVKGRAEEAPLRGEVAVSRALADLRQAVSVCGPLVSDRGSVLYFAGRTWSPSSAEDVDVEAEHGWSLSICSPSLFPWQGPIVRMSRSEERLQTS